MCNLWFAFSVWQLPSQQLESALNRHATLRAPLSAHASQPNIKSSLPRYSSHGFYWLTQTSVVLYEIDYNNRCYSNQNRSNTFYFKLKTLYLFQTFLFLLLVIFSFNQYVLQMFVMTFFFFFSLKRLLSFFFFSLKMREFDMSSKLVNVQTWKTF